MKKAICVIILICTIIIGCETENKTSNLEQYSEEERWQGFRVIVVDSCEYLIRKNTGGGGYVGYGYGFMAHKGNCKFCKERQITNIKRHDYEEIYRTKH